MELQNVKLVRTRNHLKFNLRRKQLDVIPASLNQACPLKTQRAKDIVYRAKREDGQNVLKIGYLKRDISDRQNELFAPLPCDQQKCVTDLVMKSHECMFTEVKSCHIKKLHNLTEKNKSKGAESIDLSGEQLKKCVVNISKHKLVKDETTVQSKGLNVAVPLERIPHDEFIVATELAAIGLIKLHQYKDP